MGKYTKKHEWRPCEFVYTRPYEDKKSGDRCNKLARSSTDGKYYCRWHKPSRIASMRRFALRKMKKDIERRREKIRQRLLRLGAGPIDASINTDECSEFKKVAGWALGI